MVTNTKLAKKVHEQEEETKSLRERLAQLEDKLDHVEEKTDEVKEKFEGKQPEVGVEDEVPTPDPILTEAPFLKALKDMSGKALEDIPLFSGKMEADLVMDWIELMENHFMCDGIIEAQKIRGGNQG